MPTPVSPLELACYYAIAVNFAAFAAFGLDKHRAECGGWRIRESTLLNLALFGGAAGALAGRSAFRHKLRKGHFSSTLRFYAALNILALAAVAIGVRLPASRTESATGFAETALTNPRALLGSREDQRATELSVTYPGCNEPRALGLAPLRQGEPGYRAEMDGDGDGLACE